MPKYPIGVRSARKDGRSSPSPLLSGWSAAGYGPLPETSSSKTKEHLVQRIGPIASLGPEAKEFFPGLGGATISGTEYGCSVERFSHDRYYDKDFGNGFQVSVPASSSRVLLVSGTQKGAQRCRKIVPP